MVKKLLSMKNIVLSLLALEFIVALGSCFVFDSRVSSALTIYIFIKNIICATLIYYLQQMLNDAKYSVKEALDLETKNALIFGGVGLIKYDENRNIVWVSDLFFELGLKIVGKKLLEWQPLLASLFEDDDLKTIDINSRKYEVYHSRNARLMFLKDVTDYSSIIKEYDDQQLCVAYITIDNYSQTIEYADEQKAATIQSLSRQIIFDWAKSNGIIIKRYKEDGYLAIFNERIYRKQIEDKFRLLQDFKNKIEEAGEFMSLSVGIGRGSKVLRELDEMAFNAISLSYSRGGDQVVVKTQDEAIRFFGGTTEGSEKSNRVRARVISQTLTNLIKQASNVLVMGHKYSDFDSFGSSLGIAKLVKTYDKPVNVVIDSNSLEEKTSCIYNQIKVNDEYKNLFIAPSRAIDTITDDTLLICVDNHKPSLAISEVLLDMVTKIVVIDHHRRGEEFIDLPILTYLEPSASSSVEQIVEMYEYQKAEIQTTPLEATIMYAGMLIDTNYFKTHVGSRTFQIAAILKDMQANVTKAYELLQDDYVSTQKKLTLTSSAYQYRKEILIAYGKEDETYTRQHLAKAGNDLLNISEVQAVFVVGYVSKDTVAISARSKSDINVQLIMEDLGGGGHFSMAACQLDTVNIKLAIKNLETSIQKYLNERGID